MLTYLIIGILSFTSVLCCRKLIDQCYHGNCENYHVDRCLAAVLFTFLVSAWGLKRKSLAWSGAVGGIAVGLILTFSSYCFLACVFTFFYTSSKATHYRCNQKKKFEADYKEGGQRNWIQVLCNGGAATEMALIYLLLRGPGEIPIEFDKNFLGSWLSVAVLSALACANGDTWASELGPVTTKDEPRLITTFQKVPVGTNGGITITGVFYSALGGAVVGLSYFLTLLLTIKNFAVLHQAMLLIFIGTFAGLFGSFLDSLIGATLQYSGLDSRSGKIVEKPKPGVKHISGMPVLDNQSVNLLMTIIVSIVVPTGTAELYSYFR